MPCNVARGKRRVDARGSLLLRGRKAEISNIDPTPVRLYLQKFCDFLGSGNDSSHDLFARL
jgi:hypothetical protein